MTDPTPAEILAQMVSAAPDDAVGEWRVRVPTAPRPSFAEAVVRSRQALAAARTAQGARKDAVALSNLLTAALYRHEVGQCACRFTSALTQVDPICEHAEALAYEIAFPA